MQDTLAIIDPHIHLFDLQRGNYHWLRQGNPPHWPDKHIINKDFSELDLNLSAPFELKGFVHIEAGFDNQQPWREIDWLESQCQLPFRSVAFADLTQDSFENDLEKLKAKKSVVGIRHILEEDAYSILSNKNAKRHLGWLAKADLSFDTQLYLHDQRAVNALINVLETHPNLNVILCHAGAPLADGHSRTIENWKNAIQRLSAFPNVAAKLSGWEMQNRSWQFAHICPFLDHALTCFGEERLMLASNFPLCLWRKPYSVFWRLYTDNLPKRLLTKLCFNNAAQYYRFN